MSNEDLVSLEKAAELYDKSKSNIQYLIQYGRIEKYTKDGDRVRDSDKSNDIRVSKKELEEYFEKREKRINSQRKDHVGEYDERLAFDNLSEKERTKHVHRLHPYKGKFIPQLVEFFLKRYFNKGETILDPYVGSGTALVQANEMGMNSIGIDISPFNCLISKVKTEDYNVEKLESEINNAKRKVEKFSDAYFDASKADRLKSLISEFNHSIMEDLKEKYDTHDELKKHSEKKFYEWIEKKGETDLLSENRNDTNQNTLGDFNLSDFETENEYLNEWFSNRSLKELLYYRSIIPDYEYKDVLKIILSRAARSVRLVPHYDLASPDEPKRKPYYCYKHHKICTPIQKAIGRLRRYSKDTIRRIKKFSKKRSKDCFVNIIQADARYVDLEDHFENDFFEQNNIDGIFTSPPYVGNIDYHKQHRYSYELLDFPRYDEKEIGPKFKGRSKEAREEYKEGISKTLSNLREYMAEDSLVFIVANDKYDLYPKIAQKSGMEILREFKRPVSKRAERDRKPYSEKIFKMTYI
ncbi:hypothetical protein AKJ50_00465 [candidate division MSBL1 archaeon SCGC-AAA382A13]|uniref:site-specific DNA-methyltransferase (cytosine-N(4)-specific) n=1 Tax=candidate division MSBL1 archaeon SCGC-AAA382A13 TaxID=1698279 RepID=A0A133VGM6_9EURY|nr:hypothetical protein AKJ50_00465 [candidate division MSBL1 archaeon SCGC-AAA382A13]